MKISKEKANLVAVKLTQEKYENIEKLKKELAQEIKKITLKKIPKEIMEMFSQKKYKDYFNTQSHIVFIGNGFNHDWLYLEDDLPIANPKISPDTNDASKIQTLQGKIQRETKEREVLKSEIEIAVLNLGTYANVEKEFPEAFKHLPAIISTSVTVNLKSIREKLK